uniref:Tetraspanin n=2 Tax=Schistocephalus solidus TaxID=70667 RepID=A0A0X3P3R9_SCHSO
MCCLIRSVLKCTIATINGVLAVAFLVVALLGALLKFAPQVYEKLLSMLLEKVKQEEVKQIMTFIGANASAAALVLLLVGGCVCVFCFFGLFATTCHCRTGFKIYTGILGAVIIFEAIGLGYFFGDPNAIPEKVADIMKMSLEEYGKGGVTSSGATLIWQMLMTSEEEYCCGLNSYEDFKDFQNLPPACCYNKNANALPETCNAADAKDAKVPGCQGKIDKFLAEEKEKFLIAPIILVAAQVVVFALDLFAICTKAL